MISSIRFMVETDEGWENARRWMVGHRKRMRLTQAEVARRMGTTQGEVSRLERGLSDPYLSTVRRYVMALGLTHRWNVAPKEGPDEDGRVRAL